MFKVFVLVLTIGIAVSYSLDPEDNIAVNVYNKIKGVMEYTQETADKASARNEDYAATLDSLEH